MNKTESEECEAIGSMPTQSEQRILPDITSTKKVGIYGLQNKLKPDKWYVGQSRDISRRWNEYRRLECKRHPKLFSALKKYGFDGFNKVILEECCSDILMLNEKETIWIRKYNSVDNGYNCNEGGNSGWTEHSKRKMFHSWKGKKGHSQTEETRKLISMSNTGKVWPKEFGEKVSMGRKGKGVGPRSEEVKLKISLSLAGRNHPNYGKKLSNEIKEKIRQGTFQRWHPELTNQSNMESGNNNLRSQNDDQECHCFDGISLGI
jgi:group I intron endonuclease